MLQLDDGTKNHQPTKVSVCVCVCDELSFWRLCVITLLQLMTISVKIIATNSAVNSSYYCSELDHSQNSIELC